MIQRGWLVLVISTLLGFLSVEQGGREEKLWDLVLSFPPANPGWTPSAAAGDLPPLLFFVPPQRKKPQQTLLHKTPGSSIAAQSRARRKAMWIRE